MNKLLEILAPVILRKVTKSGVATRQNATTSTAAGALLATSAVAAPLPPLPVPVEYEWVVRLVIGLVGVWAIISERIK